MDSKCECKVDGKPCNEVYTCCDCEGGNGNCGCGGCFSCNACEECLNEEE